MAPVRVSSRWKPAFDEHTSQLDLLYKINRELQLEPVVRELFHTLRTEGNFGKRTTFGESHLIPFEQVYGERADGYSPRKEEEWSFNAEAINVDKATVAENQGIDDRIAQSRWRCFSREWTEETKGDSLDISWLKDKDSVDAANLPEPEVLAGEAKEKLAAALGELDALLVALENRSS